MTVFDFIYNDIGPVETKEDWNRFVATPYIPRPSLTRTEYDTASPQRRAEFDLERDLYHSNLGPYNAPHYDAALKKGQGLLGGALQRGNRVKLPVAIDALPGMGKTLLAQSLGAWQDRRWKAMLGPYVPEGHEHIPVCFISLPGQVTPKELCIKLLDFYGDELKRGTQADASRSLRNYVRACRTRLIIVDDFHFVRPSGRDTASASLDKFLKHLVSSLGVTFLFVGVGLRRNQIFPEYVVGDDDLTQNSARNRFITLLGYDVGTAESQAQWTLLLKSIERDLVLFDKPRGLLTKTLSRYLWERTAGHPSSLFDLVSQAAGQAIQQAADTGTDRLTVSMLESVTISHLAELGQPEWKKALAQQGRGVTA